MAITSTQQTQIVNLYVGMFNKAPSAATLTSLTSSFEGYTGTDEAKLYSLAESISTSSDYTTMMASNTTAEAVALQLVSNAGLDTANIADTADLAYHVYTWAVNTSNDGVSSHVIMAAYTQFINTQSHLATEAIWQDTYNKAANKAEVAEYYATTGGATNSSTIIASVTESDSTVATAKTQVDLDNGGQSFTLTTSADEFTGTAANDTFTAALLTAGASDTLDGGDGTDSLTIETSTAISDTFVTSNIENVSIAALGSLTVNMKNMTGVESITNNASTGTLTLTNIAANAALTATSTAGATNATFTSSALGGSGDTLNLTLDGASNASFIVNAGYESTKLNVTSDSTLSGLTVPGVTTFISEGAGSLTVKDNVLDTFTTLILKNAANVTLGTDASVSLLSAAEVTGDIKAQTIDTTTDTQDRDYATDTLTLATTGGTVLTGAGNDTLSIVAGTSGTDTVRLGAGNDNLVYAFGAGNAVVDMGAGDDLLFVNTGTAGTTVNDTVDMGDGTDNVVILDTNSSDLILQNAETASIVVNTGGNTVDLDGSSAVALTIEAGTADTDITVANLTSGSTIKTINNDAATPVATGAVTVGFKAAEATSTIVFDNAVGDGDATDIVTVTKVGDLTLDFNEAVDLGTGAIETIAVADTTNLTVTAAKAFAVDDITVAADKVTDLSVTGESTVTIVDFNGTSIENLTVSAAGITDIGVATASTKLSTVNYTTTVGTLDYGAIGTNDATLDITSINLSSVGNLGVTAPGAIDAIKIGSITATSTEGTVDVGNIGSDDLDELGTVTLTAKGAIGSNTVATIDSAKITSITATSSDSSVVIGAINDTFDGDMGTITATAKTSVNIGKIGDGGAGDKMTSLTATASDGAIQLDAAAIDTIDSDGFDVTLSAATTIDSDGAGTAAVIENNDGSIGTVKLSGTAAAVVNATVADSGTTGAYYVTKLDASALTGGVTSTITNDEDLASVASTTTVTLGAASVATANSVTLAGDVDAIAVTGSNGADTIILSGTIDSGSLTLNGTGTDTLDLTLLDGKTTAANGMVVNLSANDQTVGDSTIASGYIKQWDGTNIVSTGVSLTIDSVDAIVGTNTADTIYAAGTGTTITGEAGNDNIVLGSAADTVVFSANTAANGADTISTFTIGTDGDVLNFAAMDAVIGTTGTNDALALLNGVTAYTTNSADVEIVGKVAILKGAAATSFDTAGEIAAEIGASTGANVTFMMTATTGQGIVLSGAASSTTAYVWYIQNVATAGVVTSEVHLAGTITLGTGKDIDDFATSNFVLA